MRNIRLPMKKLPILAEKNKSAREKIPITDEKYKFVWEEIKPNSLQK